jgi:predicted XRE-type DNA-binding protein
MTDDDQTEIRRGSRNVFADLGFGDPDTHLLKAQLVDRVQAILRDRGLTQSKAAEAVGMSQPDISRLLKGHFRDVSVERIMRMLTRLGCEVDIVVTSRDSGCASAPIHYRPEAAVG